MQLNILLLYSSSEYLWMLSKFKKAAYSKGGQNKYKYILHTGINRTLLRK